MRHAIEIKVNLGGDVEAALAAVGAEQRPEERRVWFVEDGASLLTLLRQGVILRVRSGEDRADTTAKLRPVDPVNLIGPWAQPFSGEGVEYDIEGDWSGDRHLTAASAQVRHRVDDVVRAVERGDPASIFGDRQRALVSDCAHVDLATTELRQLGPIMSFKWERLRVGDVRKVNAERWVVRDLDFLELSIRVKPEDDESAAEFARRAEGEQHELLDAVADLGLQLDTHGESKTQRVLTALSAPPPHEVRTAAAQHIINNERSA